MEAKGSPRREEFEEVLAEAVEEARRYLGVLDDSPAHTRSAEEWASWRTEHLPEEGVGALPALRQLIDHSRASSVATSGPRCFHFVIGGTTPAALGADWLASAWDQMAYAWVASPLATTLELQSLRWLRDLFGLPASGGGVMTTGATMANFVGLACARQWWGERHGIDTSEIGMGAAPPLPVFSSGHVHASSRKCLGMLGIGRGSLEVLARDEYGTLDLTALESRLTALNGAPSIVIANAGEVNNGEFDPIAAVADLCEKHNAWMHLDGAFGLFARVSPQHRSLARGAERAQSITVDGHKWLNVPYDCGFSFVQDDGLMARAFTYTADYLPGSDDPRPNLGAIGPESSRRARSLAVWATLMAYGRQGYRAMVERHVALARHMADRVQASGDLELLAEPRLNIVCLRYNPGGLTEPELDRRNERLGAELLADGRVYAGTTRYGGKVALRPAIVNWRTREEDVDLFVDVVRELGSSQ